MTDLLALTAELVAIPSLSHHETALADRVEAELRRAAHLDVTRFDDTVVARTELGRARRVVLAGHLDTVPPFDDAGGRVEDDTLWGLGAVDMKGGLAVLLDLAASVPGPDVDVTYVFYACEEVAREHNALARLAATRPDLLAADAAVLGEPTGGVVEAGCQGTMRAVVMVGGRRAHTSRPWMGVNARAPPGPDPRRGWGATSRAASWSTGVSTPSSSRRWGSKGASPATWCPTGPPSQSISASRRPPTRRQRSAPW